VPITLRDVKGGSLQRTAGFVPALFSLAGALVRNGTNALQNRMRRARKMLKFSNAHVD
jgi:hypothetical protein